MRFEPRIHRTDSNWGAGLKSEGSSHLSSGRSETVAAPNQDDDLPPELLAVAEELADSARVIARASQTAGSSFALPQDNAPATTPRGTSRSRMRNPFSRRFAWTTAATAVAVAIGLGVALTSGMLATGNPAESDSSAHSSKKAMAQSDANIRQAGDSTHVSAPNPVKQPVKQLADSAPQPQDAPKAGSFIEVQPGSAPQAPPIRVQELQGAELDGAIDLVDEDVLLPL